jgi:predicted metalloprotease
LQKDSRRKELNTVKNKFQFATISAAALLVASLASGDGLQVTRTDVNQMKYKINMASSFFEATWKKAFAQAGRSYPTPRLVAYESPMQSGCGPTKMGNAFYCRADHAIYYDAIFLTAMMKQASIALGTDGDYAPIVILAHEMGHAVAYIMGTDFVFSYPREALADCLAGVVTNEAKKAGNLEAGDLEEGLWALNDGGDGPNTSIISDHAHGKGPDRQKAFLIGFRGGLSACDDGIAKKLAAIRPTTTQQPTSRTIPTSFPGGYQSR